MRYAIVKNNIVENVIEYETQPTTPPPGFEEGYVAIQSDFVSVGWSYKDELFTPPQPYPSWVLVNNEWEAPISKPQDNKMYMWDDTTLSWIEIK